ncbi:hypothetical protein [Paragemmobacter straminiformis]|uniref:Lipoprotein n=1 Tax=Paragemmobacter straminiformis TaxID=2045119 RepID=A0A842I4T9_9RHOB|nr:hypothetical protein [Gemmobacter straminiformis]MBC2834629.1 hypothetical protein [Gemmobacter straminiformis]
MRRLALSLSILPLLAACGTPQEQCINRNTRDLRTVEKLVSEVQGNLDRGYAYEEYIVTVPVWKECVVPSRDPAVANTTRPCLEDEVETRTRPVAIDLNAERAKLESLYTKRDQLSREAQSVIAQCKAQYPES